MINITFVRFDVAGTTYGSDVQNIRVNNLLSVGANRFDAVINNQNGKYSGTFSVGQDVTVYHDVGSPAGASTQVFRGQVEEVRYEAKQNRDLVVLNGRDYAGLLEDVTANDVFRDLPAGSIVRVLMNKYVSGVTFGNVGATDGPTIANIRFKHKSIFNAIKEVAEISNYDFYVDFDKVLNFVPDSSVSSGFTFASGNIRDLSVDLNKQEMYNRVWVYGDRYLSGWRETFTADGGSVFTLTYKPHDTTVQNATVYQRGGIFEIGISSLPSGAQYLVDFDARRIVFVSGTVTGNNIPASGNNIIVDYQRSLPIVKIGENKDSIKQHNVREKFIMNAEIKVPSHAEEVVRRELDKHAFPKRNIDLVPNAGSVQRLNVGNTARIYYPNSDTSGTFKLVESSYNFNTQTLQGNDSVWFRFTENLSERRLVHDMLREYGIQIQELKGAMVDDSDLISRMEFSTGSFGIRSNWYVRTRTLGSSFILSHVTAGRLGGGLSPQNYLGDSRSALTVQASGGEW